MSTDIGIHKPVIRLIRQFVGEDKNGTKFSYSRYPVYAVCSACNKTISRGFWTVVIDGSRRYYHDQCVQIEEP